MIAHPTPDLRSGLIDGISSAIPYALTGALLIVRRPGLPFGWLLAGTAALASVADAPASGGYLVAITGGSLTLGHIALAVNGVTFLPTAVQGVINMRFPSGRPSSRAGRLLEVAIGAGSALGLIGGALNGGARTLRPADGTSRTIEDPLTAGTEIGRIAAGLTVVVPIVILLGALAGLGVVRGPGRRPGSSGPNCAGGRSGWCCRSPCSRSPSPRRCRTQCRPWTACSS